MAIDPRADAGFNAGSGAYDRGRPSYPPDVVDWLCERALDVGGRVLDLGAGTGKMTAVLAARGLDVVAAEPVAAMRDALRAALPDVPVAAAAAERLPFAARSFDAVFVAQAFHWFDAGLALAEVARVLRPGGGLALVWNERDESAPWVAELSRVIQWDVKMPYRTGTDWRDVIDATGLFTPTERRTTTHAQAMDAELLVDRILSTSYIAAMRRDEQDEIVRDVRRLAERLGERFDLPYVTDAFACRLP